MKKNLSHNSHESFQYPQKSTFYVRLLTGLSCIGGFLFGYDTGVISGAMLLLSDEFNLDDNQKQLIVGMTVAGALVASVFSGYISDLYGRRNIILFSSLVFSVGSLTLSLAGDYPTLIVGRFIVGLGVGMASSIIPIYISESSPHSIRGYLVTTLNIAITFGQFFSSCFNMAFVNVPEGWRYMLGFGAIPAVIQFIGFLFLPESPRWLIENEQIDKATKSLQILRNEFDVRDEIQTILLSIPMTNNNKLMNKKSSFQLILNDIIILRSLLLGCMLQAAQQFLGINTIMYYSSTILIFAGFTSTIEILGLTAIVSLFNFIGSCIGLYNIDLIGRRILTLNSLILVIFCLACLSVLFYVTEVTTLTSTYDSLSNECSKYQYCFDCVQNLNCGFCSQLNINENKFQGCIPTATNDDSRIPANITLCPNYENVFYTTSCPNTATYGWIIFVFLCLYLLSFAPGKLSLLKTNSFAHSFILRLFNYSFVYLSNQSINQLINLSINQSINHLSIHSFMHSFIHSFICLLIIFTNHRIGCNTMDNQFRNLSNIYSWFM